jgi:hypothetical protein
LIWEQLVLPTRQLRKFRDWRDFLETDLTATIATKNGAKVHALPKSPGKGH